MFHLLSAKSWQDTSNRLTAATATISHRHMLFEQVEHKKYRVISAVNEDIYFRLLTVK